MSARTGRGTASLDVVAASPAGTVVEFRGGDLDGQMLHLPRALNSGPTSGAADAPSGYCRPTPYRLLDPTSRDVADARADGLLRSVLDPHQRGDRRDTGGFWVDLGHHGRIRLGRLHHLPHRPSAGPVFERILCAVPDADPDDPGPTGDIWTNLILAVRHDPGSFFEVANVLSSRPRTDDDRRYDDLSTDQLGALAAGHHRNDRIRDGAAAEFELARRFEARRALRRAADVAVRAALGELLSSPATAPRAPSDAERRDRGIATAERLVWSSGSSIADLAPARNAALARLTGPTSRPRTALIRRADTLIAAWTSST